MISDARIPTFAAAPGGATAGASKPTLSIAGFADYLVDGYWRADGNIGHSFDTGADGTITANIAGLTPDGQQMARWAFQAWEQVADIRFVIVSGGADITIDDEYSGATTSASWYTTGPDAGETLSADINISQGWLSNYGTGIGSYAFSTFIHEIGHALGLGHPGDYNDAADYADATFANDSVQMSVMSYFDQSQNPTVRAGDATPITPMIADILAVQKLYGASATTSGATTWGANSNLGNYLGSYFDAFAAGQAGNEPVALTLYDAGGRDRIDLAFSEGGDRIDLRPGTFSDIGGVKGNVGIALGTIIEDVAAGFGDDTVIGNAAGNDIYGNGGNDILAGAQGSDMLVGGFGDDRLFGGSDDDLLWGSAGDDRLAGGGGNDILGAADGNDRLAGGFGDDQLWSGAGDDTAQGGAGEDSIGGGLGNDTALLGAGDDLVFGAGGNDSLRGDSGNDEIWAGWGADTLAGNYGDDTLRAGAGDDILKGGPGADLLSGGGGADSFHFAGGDGADTVTDFRFWEGDRLQLDADLWWGSRNADAVVRDFAGLDGEGNVVLDFGGDSLTLAKVTALSSLAEAIDIV